MAIRLDGSYYDYSRFTKIGHLTDFKDIKVGETYHIPPTIIYDRRDIVVESKTDYTITGQAREADGTWKKMTLYQNELQTRFLVKLQKINEK